MFPENDTSPEVCVALTDVIANRLDREVTVNIEIGTTENSTAKGLYV